MSRIVGADYPEYVTAPTLRRFVLPGASLAAIAFAVEPAAAERAVRARLVHCGAESCLRLSGHRDDVRTVVRVGTSDLAVEGARDWQVTVPLAVARGWPIARGYALRVVLADRVAGTERTQSAALPPGALGTRTEIASLVVAAP